MLRSFFGERKRTDSGMLLEAFHAIDAFIERLSHDAHADRGSADRRGRKSGHTRFYLWAKGLRTSLDELEQSKYCSERFRMSIRHRLEDEMTAEERDDYYRHVYFFKNAFIRVFSILDKLGYFLNEWFDLQTERKKSRFSYFTVLRRIHETGRHPELGQRLSELKVRYQEPLNRLRSLRNMEVHWINAELQDDWKELYTAHFRRLRIENLQENGRDLELGFEMVCLTLNAAFHYIGREMPERGKA